jgi:hypothetical protein
MRKQDAGYDHHRYQQLLAEAVDEKKRLELIALLIEERAKDRLAAQRESERSAMTASTIARVLGPNILGPNALGPNILAPNTSGPETHFRASLTTPGNRP